MGQITTTNRNSEDEIKERIRKSWSCFGKNREIFMDKNLPLSSKRQSFEPMHNTNYSIRMRNMGNK